MVGMSQYSRRITPPPPPLTISWAHPWITPSVTFIFYQWSSLEQTQTRTVLDMKMKQSGSFREWLFNTDGAKQNYTAPPPFTCTEQINPSRVSKKKSTPSLQLLFYIPKFFFFLLKITFLFKMFGTWGMKKSQLPFRYEKKFNPQPPTHPPKNGQPWQY